MASMSFRVFMILAIFYFFQRHMPRRMNVTFATIEPHWPIRQKNSVDLYKRIAFLYLSIRLKVRLEKLKNKMNIKSGLLFLTIFEINVNAFAKRGNDLEYLKTNAHQLHVSRISFILFAMTHRLCLIVNGFFKLNSVISKRHGPLPSSQFTGRLSCKHVGDRWFDGWWMVIFRNLLQTLVDGK